MVFSESLKKNKDFRAVYNGKKFRANRYFVMYIKKNDTQYNRLGISVSKKVGNSVIRHRVTRLVRESYRLHENLFEKGFDIVVIARESARDVTYAQTENAVLHLAKLHHILKVFFYS